jgi:hypothetical protein
MRLQTASVDFDGVIHAYRRGWHDGTCYDEPVTGAGEALDLLLAQYAVVINSSRSSLPIQDWMHRWFPHIPTVACDHYTQTPFWEERGVILITQKKMPSAVYIDDRGLHFTSWHTTLTALGLA